MSFVSTYSAASIRAWQSQIKDFSLYSQTLAPNTTTNSQYSRALAISGDGNYITMGSPALNRNVGVYTGPLYPSQANLTPSYAGNDNFGTSLAINYNGDTIAGADRLNGNVIIFTRSGSTWTESQILTGLGTQSTDKGLSMDDTGDYLAVGNGNPQVYYRSNGTYSLQQSITGINGTSGIQSVMLNSSGNYLLYGNVGESPDGAVYIYNRTGNSWTLEQKITPNNGTAGDAFGTAIDINEYGNIIVVGSPAWAATGAGVGQVYIFTKSGNTWSQYANISGTFKSGSNVFGIDFGTGVAINNIGDTIYAGAPGDNGTTGNINISFGSTFIYSNVNGTWTQTQKINSPITTDNSLFFGNLISTNNQGTILAISAPGYDGPNANVGTGYVFSNL